MWVIADGEDTTVSPNTHCTYDRIVASRQAAEWFSADPGRAGVTRDFRDVTLSDHYPVWAELRLHGLR